MLLTTGACLDEGGFGILDAGGPDAARDGPLDGASTTPDAATGSDGSICGDACDDAGGPVPEGPARYPADRTLSPITPFVADFLRGALGAGLREDVFAKVGDSITVSTSFLHCFAGDAVDLAGRDELVPSLELFLGGAAEATTPFDRVSLAAGVGWSAFAAIEGAPSPLERELDAIDPAFAIVMFGTNDVGWREAAAFGADLLAIVDTLLGRGVIPLLSSIPPRDDDPQVDTRVPLFSAMARGVAQGRQIPFMDLERELRPLPGHGLGGDGVHPDAYQSGGARPCVFTPEGLQHGYNWRNLLALQTLARVSEVVLDGADAPDPAEPVRDGNGTTGAPFRIDATVYSDLASTAGVPQSDLDHYGGCSAAQDESGPEIVYALTLEAPATVRAVVADGPDVDVDLHLLGGAIREDACLARHDRELALDLDAGEYFLVLDTFVPGDGRARAGEFLLVVLVQ